MPMRKSCPLSRRGMVPHKRSSRLPGGTPDPAPSLTPGALAVQGGRLFVGTADDPLVLTEVQPAGKKAMDAAAWARGLGELDGKVLA